MDLQLFFTIIAWPIAICATVLVALRIIAYMSYSELERLEDSCRGRKRIFPITRASILALITWAWIIAS